MRLINVKHLRDQIQSMLRRHSVGVYAFDKTRQTNGEKGKVPRQLDTGRAEKLPERVNCANRWADKKEI